MPLSDDAGTHRRIVRYLLGQLSKSEEAIVGQQRTDDKIFDELVQAVEEEMIDDFVQGRLSFEDLRCFEEHYLITPERLQKVEFARTLQMSFAQPATQRGGLWIAAASAGIIILMLLVGSRYWSQPSAVVSYTLAPGSVRDI